MALFIFVQNPFVLKHATQEGFLLNVLLLRIDPQLFQRGV